MKPHWMKTCVFVLLCPQCLNSGWYLGDTEEIFLSVNNFPKAVMLHAHSISKKRMLYIDAQTFLTVDLCLSHGPLPSPPHAKHLAKLMFLTHIQVSSVAQLCPTLCDPMNRNTPGLPVHHQLPESTETHVHWISDAIQPSHPLLSPSPPAFNLSQHQGLFKWVSSSHQVAKVLEFQLQHQPFQWTPRTNLL